jgi:hypothetical protein
MLTGSSGGSNFRLNATGTFSATDGAVLGTFNGQQVIVKVVNGKLNAYSYDTAGGPLVFKPGHWVFKASVLSQADAEKFSQTDPATGFYYAPDISGYTGSRTGESGTGGSTTPPPSGGGGGGNNGGGGNSGGGGNGGGGNTGNNLLDNLTGKGGTTTTTTGGMNILVIVGIVAAVGALVYFLAKKK